MNEPNETFISAQGLIGSAGVTPTLYCQFNTVSAKTCRSGWIRFCGRWAGWSH